MEHDKEMRGEHIDSSMSNNIYKSIATKIYPNAQVKDVVPFTAGVSADVCRLDLQLTNGEPRSLVLRAHRSSHNGHPADLEYTLLKALSFTDIPVAKPLLVDISGDILPQPFVRLEFVEGSSHVPKEHENYRIKLIASMLVKIHSVPVDDVPLLPTRNNPLPELFSYFPEGHEWSRLRQYLHRISDTAYRGSPVLLHGDFWPENILWKGQIIAAVLDWEDAAIGDPLSDVACCALELRYKFGKSRMQEFIQAYAQHRPIDKNRLALWQVYVATAAQHHMGDWGLEPTIEKHMRGEALASLREAGAILFESDLT